MIAHTDNSASEKTKNEISRLLIKRKHLLCPEEDTPQPPPLPVDTNDLRARKSAGRCRAGDGESGGEEAMSKRKHSRPFEVERRQSQHPLIRPAKATKLLDKDKIRPPSR